jgi:hypothetical protein
MTTGMIEAWLLRQILLTKMIVIDIVFSSIANTAAALGLARSAFNREDGHD